tara:strand:- start:2697 stop:2843 length:147 start_codon:yes stop_codon:yes gene_type:complete
MIIFDVSEIILDILMFGFAISVSGIGFLIWIYIWHIIKDKRKRNINDN